MFGKVKKIHFVGIGGIGMSGIAEVLYNIGFQVSGSDIKISGRTEYLEKLGVNIHIGHKPELVIGTDVVVYSSAVKGDNPELIEAEKNKIPVIPRAEMLAELMRMKYSIAIAGAHGKTTTTSMLAKILTNAGFDPTVVVGGIIKGLGTNAKLGKGKYLIAEADESDKSFLKLLPTIGVITNIDEDHLDIYSDIDEIKSAFIDFANKIPFYGDVYICEDDRNIRTIIPHIKKRFITYGIKTRNAQIKAYNLIETKGFYTFEFTANRTYSGKIRLKVPGIHNVYNALASTGVGLELEIPINTIIRALSSFEGVKRRFEILGRFRNGIVVVDDYAHHPTEIQVILKVAKQQGYKRVIAIFQPHLYSRTIKLLDRFSNSFQNADIVILTDIYGAREKPVKGITGEILYRAVKDKKGKEVYYIPNLDLISEKVGSMISDNDIILTIGAGNIFRTGEKIVKKLLESGYELKD